MGQDPIGGLLQPGHILQDRYRILGVLGTGGIGAVYQARDLHLKNVTRLVAIKEVITLTDDQGLRERLIRNFEREIETLAILSHPAIPSFFDCFTVGDCAYLVMEYIQGRNLENSMSGIARFLPVAQVHWWAIELCDALHYLHTHQPPIVFRDMKPADVMIDNRRRVRLVDFGAAAAWQPGARGALVGTDGYSPPEVHEGYASPASDIYALGATFHHVLTRCDPRMEPPFSFEDRPIRDYNPDVPEALAAIVMRALAYDPADRFATAEEMKQALLEVDR